MELKEYFAYLVQPGDTLQGVSRRLGLSPIDIMAYHNNNCEKHEKIASGEPITVEEILISPDLFITTNAAAQSLLVKRSNKSMALSAGFKLTLKPNNLLHKYRVLISAENENTINIIKYENSIQCIESSKEHFIFEINRISNTYIDDDVVDDIANELAVKTASVLFPLHVFIDNKGNFISVANNSAIKNRWAIIKESILGAYEGTFVEKYLYQAERTINSEHALNASLKNDYFLRAFFNGIYASYTATLGFDTDAFFPILKNTSEPKYRVRNKIKKHLDEYELVCVEQKGILDDDRCAADFENRFPTPHFSLMQSGVPKAKGSYSAKYFLNADTHIIESMHLKCDIQLGREKKVEITIRHITNSENAKQ